MSHNTIAESLLGGNDTTCKWLTNAQLSAADTHTDTQRERERERRGHTNKPVPSSLLLCRHWTCWSLQTTTAACWSAVPRWSSQFLGSDSSAHTQTHTSFTPFQSIYSSLTYTTNNCWILHKWLLWCQNPPPYWLGGWLWTMYLMKQP